MAKYSNMKAGFDIEIYKDVPDMPRWRQYTPLGITCAALHFENGEQVIGYAGFPGEPENRPMTPDELTPIVIALAECQSITWNGQSFDFHVLGIEYDNIYTAAELSRNHIDMMFHLLCAKGFPLKLQTACVGQNLYGKTQYMSGELAPLMWQGNRKKMEKKGAARELLELSDVGMREKVIEYVLDDAKNTWELYKRTVTQRAMRWTSQKGRPMSFALPNGWMSVSEALELPLPNTAWMTDPMTRESACNWMEE